MALDRRGRVLVAGIGIAGGVLVWFGIQMFVAWSGLPGGRPPAPPVVRPEPPADEVAEITEILIGYRQPSGREANARSKEEALALATRLIERIRAGERMESLLLAYTDDRTDDGKPFNNGTYSIARRRTPAKQALKDAVFALKPGELHPLPVDMGSAYVVIRRDS